MTRCGFSIHKVFQVVGASPDGLTACNCCGLGVLELKCPLCLEEGDLSSTNYLKMNDCGKLQLIVEHPYYYQCQMQMICTGRQFADFFVWSTKKENWHLERIYKNEAICKRILTSSLSFFRTSIAPELFAMYYSKGRHINATN